MDDSWALGEASWEVIIAIWHVSSIYHETNVLCGLMHYGAS
jgi:hypothetical protein